VANIREYVSDQGFQPSNRPAQAQAAIGEGWSDAYSSVGRNVGEGIAAIGSVAMDLKEKYVDQREISQGAKLATQRVDELTRQWQDIARNSDPNDASIYDKFMNEIVEPSLEKFQDAFSSKGGQEWALNQTIKMRSHFSTSARADISSRAGTAAVMNAEAVTSNLANTAFRDPASLDFALNMLNDSWAATKGNLALDAEQAAKFDAALRDQQNGIVLAGMKGMADTNPNQFLADLAAGKLDGYDQFLSPEDKIAARAYGEQRKNAAEADASAARAEAERAAKAFATANVNKIYADYLGVAEDGSLFVKAGAYGAVLSLAGTAGADENLVTSTAAAIRAIDNDAQKRLKRVSDPYTIGDFNARLFLPEDDPNRLTIEQINLARAPSADGTPGLLSNEHFNYYRQALLTKSPDRQEDSKQFELSIKQYVPYINQSGPLTPGTPEGQQRENEFRLNKWQEFQARRAAGMSRDKALEGLFNDYQRYQVTMEQSLTGLTSGVEGGRSALPAVVPSADTAYRPGESMADYAARLQGKKPVGTKVPFPEFNERFEGR
jgi:hypothetical protein